MKRVSVFMDVEDPINPLADDAALDFPRLFEEAGVRGSFCLTGEKCRTLKDRGRADVAEAYASHCLGLHTDTHSYHPTTMELLADLPFEQGCVAALAAESRGYGAFEDLFSRSPSFWGGAGNTWSPEIATALKKLAIPAYVYALTALPGHAVHKFDGVIALPQALSISESEWGDDARAEAAVSRVFEALERIEQPWIGLFVGHPTRFRYEDYWDRGLYGGVTPASPVFTQPVSEVVYENGKKNLRHFLVSLARKTDVIGVNQALNLPWQFRPLDSDETAFFESQTAQNILNAAKWPIHRPDLNPEWIVAKTLALKDTVEIAFL